jgi:hypothetical protein
MWRSEWRRWFGRRRGGERQPRSGRGAQRRLFLGQRLRLPPGTISARLAVFSPDGAWLVLARSAGDILLFDLRRFNGPVAKLSGSRAQWSALGFAASPPSVIARLADGSPVAWRYFPDAASLLETEHYLPRIGGSRSNKDELPAEDRCKPNGVSRLLPVSSWEGQPPADCQ